MFSSPAAFYDALVKIHERHQRPFPEALRAVCLAKFKEAGERLPRELGGEEPVAQQDGAEPQPKPTKEPAKPKQKRQSKRRK